MESVGEEVVALSYCSTSGRVNRFGSAKGLMFADRRGNMESSFVGFLGGHLSVDGLKTLREQTKLLFYQQYRSSPDASSDQEHTIPEEVVLSNDKAAKDDSGIRKRKSAKSKKTSKGKVYIAEKIVNERLCGTEMQYCIEWKDFGDIENTWEPTTNLLDPQLIALWNQKKSN